ncbi:MAG: hypothetical protein NC203_08580 [Firmicutes bacterium]|nr:hypothetical protein [Bacillota bacterium]
MEITEDVIEKAYKKLKSSVYFDKTQLILRNAIVEFEMSHDDLDEYLHSIFVRLGDKEKFDKLQEEILSSISILSFPKKLENDNFTVISNFCKKENKVTDLQHFINMKVEGHILGVLWIMLIGYKIDTKIYDHSYGNRIRKNLINELSDKPTYSPYLFEPYFIQYESWRDNALTEAKKHMALEQDVVIITMDFKRYYYSIDADKSVFDTIFSEVCVNGEEENYFENSEILKRLNEFVYAVVNEYSCKFGNEYNKRNILPIGFLPSNIIGNWCLRNFDKAIVDGWNPVYYGRYVDDVLIVDKVERNSNIYNKAKDESIKSEDVIKFFLTQCSKWSGISNLNCKENSVALLKEFDKKDNIAIYRINPIYNVIDGNKSEIIVQNDKVKIFYFKSGESDALLTCFRDKILKNKSEFRHLPEDEAVFQNDDYSDIFSLKNNESINKLRGVDGIEIDKYELSKFLGKYLRIGGMIQDKIETKFEKDILKIFNLRTIIENYSAWEKIIEIFVINERFDATVHFVEQIISAIESIEYNPDEKHVSTSKIKRTLYLHLHSILCRTFALVWKEDRIIAQEKIYSIDSFAKNIRLRFNRIKRGFNDYLDDWCIAYCQSHMIDKSVLPINISILVKNKSWAKDIKVNLTNFSEVLSIVSKDEKDNIWENNYKYYPYIVTMYDFSIISFAEEIKKQNNTPFANCESIGNHLIYNYITTNYNLQSSDYRRHDIEDLISIKKFNNMSVNSFLVSVGKGKKTKLKLAVANVKLNHQNFKCIVEDNTNRSYERYRDLSKIVNQAIDQNADMLVMPEAYVPFEWLSTLARTCAKSNLAIITGVEHIKDNNKMYNFTAVILPYSEGDYKCAYISFHLKKHYAPSEKEEINGYRLSSVEGDHYELYKWNDCYFPVYCCYELTSITDRALFQSYADMIVAVEWNRDINYYSNILESLSRDVHCYCVQVNTSDYGDSRITQPSKTEEKDIIRTKGGINNTILVGDIDIKKLREFQFKEYSLQKGSNFKSTPPGFNIDVVLKKIKGENLVD